METQNITLSLPKNLLRKVKHLAIDRTTSVTRLVAGTLEEIVGQAEAYERARQEHLAMLEEGFDLGTRGSIPWSRESLHER
jgi:hypothetical protein